MIIVLDASAAVNIVVRASKEQALSDRISNADWVIAPHLFISEVTNTFWKYHSFGAMDVESCEKAIDHAIALPDDYFSEEELYKEAFQLACINKKPVYDMFYIVLARRNNAHLLTEDKTLKHIAAKQSIRLFE